MRLDGLGKVLTLTGNFVGALLPDLGQACKQGAESGAPVTILGRIIGAAEERFELRRKKNAHRPTSRASRTLNKSHIDAVHVGPLLPIDLNTDEVII